MTKRAKKNCIYRLLTQQIISALIILNLLISSFCPIAVLAATDGDVAPESAPVVDNQDANPTTDSSDSEKGTSFKAFESSSQTALTNSDPNPVPQRRTDQDVTSVSNKLEPDLNTGAMKYSYNLEVPNGRNGQKPKLVLNYSSQNNSNFSIYGYGWSDSIPYVERTAKRGVNNLYSDNYFNSSFDGELASTSPFSYIPLVETLGANHYQFINNSWSMSDTKGNTYIFGETVNSRLDDPNNANRVARWYLTREVDSNGNSINYYYSKDSSQIYPERITYSNNGTLAGIYEIRFDKELRPDNFVSYQNQFLLQNSYRINKVHVFASGQEVKTYTLNFSQSTANLRSLLSSVQVTGIDDYTHVAVSLPPTQFNYSKENVSFREDPTYNLPASLIQQEFSYSDNGTRFADLNGDGYQDFILAQAVSDNGIITKSDFWLNTGSGWVVNPEWSSPVAFMQAGFGINQPMVARGVQVVDLNGDNRTDFIESGYFPPYSPSVFKNTYLNSGSGILKSDIDTSTSSMPFFFRWWLIATQDKSGDMGSRLADVNADGLVDIISSDSDTGLSQTYLNNGLGFYSSNQFLSPVAFTAPRTRWNNGDVLVDRGTRIVDFNGDGLPDIIMETGGVLNQLYLNTGSDFVSVGSELYGTSTIKITSGATNWEDLGVRLLDYNADGFTDIAVSTSTNNQNRVLVYLNDGKKFSLSNYTLPLSFLVSATTSPKMDSGTVMIDVNGDGLEDEVRAFKRVGIPPDLSSWSDFQTFINTGTRPDILTGVSESVGSKIGVVYKPSTWYKNNDGTLANSKLSSIFNTVSAITVDDGLGNIATTTYQYSNGEFWFKDSIHRHFAGFGKSIVIDPQDKKTVSYFHQDDGLATSTGERIDHWVLQGLPYRTEIFDKDNRKIGQNTILYSYVSRPYGGVKENLDQPYFVYSKELTSFNIDPLVTTNVFTSANFDPLTGNLISSTTTPDSILNNDGSLTGLGPKSLVARYQYNGPFSGLLTEESKFDENNINLSLTQTDYDSKGNPTKNRVLLEGDSLFASTTLIYNNYGQVVRSIDPQGNTINYTYDPMFVYPKYVDDALQHHVSYPVYDYSANKSLYATDVNGRTWKVELDGLDRLVKEKSPSLSTSGSVVTVRDYNYYDDVMPRKVIRRDYRSPADYTEATTYLNGLGQKIKEESSGELMGQSIIKTYTYNNLGQLISESLPYFNTEASNLNLDTNYSYDYLGRPKTVATSLGTTTYSYQGYQSTVTDALNHQHDFIKDGFGNLVKVKEYDNGQVYDSTYNYDRLGNLVGLVDAAGNVRSLTYDKIGRRLTISDLHASADSTFGTYAFTYDKNGNLIKKVDPNSQTVNYTYDALNRILTEDFTGSPGIEITYDYDNCLLGVGKLCRVGVNGLAATTFYYNNRGGIASEFKSIAGGGLFGLNYAYDNLDNVTSYTVGAPSTTVAFKYNTRNLVKKVDVGINGATSTYANNVLYAPHGAIAGLVFGNSASTVYNYDASKRYRLIGKSTTLGTTTIQDLSYDYDLIGNVINLSENANTPNKKTVSYSYDDLYRLTSAGYTNMPTGGSYQENYTYDSIGNITSRTGTGNYLYEGTGYANPHALTKVVNGPNAISYTYDNNGNGLKLGSYSLTYNYNNQPTKIVTNSSLNTYAYDYDGERLIGVSGNTAGTTTRFYPNKFLNLALGTSTYHVFLGNNLLATIERKGSTTNTYYISTDHLGGSSVVTDSNKKVVEISDYYPYGNPRLDDRLGAFREQRKFTGHEQDFATGFTYMGARYYNGSLGRFLSQDPMFWSLDSKLLADPQQLNAYSYARNNPIVYVDPNGENIQQGNSYVRGVGISLISAISILKLFINVLNNPQQIFSIGHGMANSVRTIQSDPVHYLDNAAKDVGKSLKKSFKDPEASGLLLGNIGVFFITGGENSLAKGLANDSIVASSKNLLFEGLWTQGNRASRSDNAIYHALSAGNGGSGHAVEFGLDRTASYVRETRNFLQQSLDDVGVLAKVQKGYSHDTLRVYNPSSNTFGAYRVNNFTGGVTPKTMFRPNQVGYFDQQMGYDVDITKYFQQ